jgi:hypothetical protein
MSWLRFYVAQTLKILVASWPRSFHILTAVFPTEALIDLSKANGSLTLYSGAFKRTHKTAKNASCVSSKQQSCRTHPQNSNHICLDTAVISSQTNKKTQHTASGTAVTQVTIACFHRQCQNQRSSAASRKYLLKIGVERNALQTTGTASNFNLKTEHTRNFRAQFRWIWRTFA